jgi:phenylpropionate dioxygenase-like ring-hydroxylating dioxygenase large terminal subunit
MNESVKPPLDSLLEVGRFDPENAELSWTLPSNWYFDARIYRLEQDRIFARTWCYQCHQRDIANPGDSYHGKIAERAVTIQRQSDGSLRAYDPFSHDPVAVEIYAGFVFANLDPAATALAQQAGKLNEDIYRCCPRLDELVRVRRIERKIAANWKTVIDNNHECYHCALNHKSLMKLVDYENQADWSDDGITFSHRVKRRQLDNPAYPLRADECEQDSLFGYIWPGLIPLWFPGSPSAVLFQVIPTGPETCIARHDFYLLDDRPSAQEQGFIDYIDRELVPEDIALCEAVQRGLHSHGYHQGRFIVDRENPGYSEHHVHFFQQFVYRALRGN